MKKIKIEPFWDVQDTVVLGVSGGVDSMVLLDVFLNMPLDQRPIIAVACVNHGMRSNAVNEVALVQRVCQEYAIPFFTNEVIPAGISSELQAREFRYQFFEDTVRHCHARYLVTAHHRDDQTETVLMKWIRGEFLTRLTGIAYKRQWLGECTLIRPFLSYSKSDLLQYAQHHDVPFLEDDSNHSRMYFRNRVRQTILPLLQKENPKLNNAVDQFVDDLSDMLDMIEAETERVYASVVQNDQVHKPTLLALPRAIQKHVLMKWLTTHCCLTRATLNSLLLLINKADGEKLIQITHEKQCVVTYEWLMMRSVDKAPKLDMLGDFYVSQEKTDETIACVSLSQQPFAIRFRKEGDILALEKYKKKVSRIFIDEKIPASMRDTIAVVVDKDDQVVAILHSELVYLSKRQETGKIYTHYLNYRKRE